MVLPTGFTPTATGFISSLQLFYSATVPYSGVYACIPSLSTVRCSGTAFDSVSIRSPLGQKYIEEGNCITPPGIRSPGRQTPPLIADTALTDAPLAGSPPPRTICTLVSLAHGAVFIFCEKTPRGLTWSKAEINATRQETGKENSTGPARHSNSCFRHG